MKEKKSIIGLYLGSFDPFHDGHMEVIEVMLQFCDKIIVTAAKKNKSKPHLSPYDHRVALIKNYIMDNPNVYFEDSTP